MTEVAFVPHAVRPVLEGLTSLDCELSRSLNFSDGAGALDVSLTIPSGRWLALLEPSGAGKTTLLRLQAGLTEAHAGFIRIGDDPWLDVSRKLSVPTRLRRIGFVFQDHALFPHMTARKNIEFARPPGSDMCLVDDLLEMFGLIGLADRFPAQLSEGQQQRLALTRALAVTPRLLLLDEPLSVLDERLPKEMQELLLEVRHRRMVDCVLLVTHDTDDAALLADRAVHLNRGAIVADAASCRKPSLVRLKCSYVLTC